MKKPLAALAFAGMACLLSYSAAAEEEKHPEKREKREAGPAGSGARSAPGGGYGSSGGNGGQGYGGSRDSDGPSFGGSLLNDLLFGSSSDSSSSPRPNYGPPAPSGDSTHSSGFQNLSTELQLNGYATYFGLAGGRGAAYYPASSAAQFAWQLYVGGRMKYVGVEFEYSHLSTVPATINYRAVDVTTEALSLSLLGYLPLSPDADLYLRYGSMNWTVSADSNATGYFPVTNGFNRVYGAGVEYRYGAILLAAEEQVFRNVYQSNHYSFLGVRLGYYFD